MLSRIICLLIVILEVRGLYLSFEDRRWKILAYYTQLSNIAALLSAVPAVIFGETPFTVLLRYTSSCMLVMTFFVTTCILIFMGGNPKRLLFTGTGFYHHLLIPVLSVGSYLLLEAHVVSAAAIALPTALTCLYGTVMLIVNSRDVFDGPYPFFRVKKQSAFATVLWMIGLTCAIGLISLAVFALGR